MTKTNAGTAGKKKGARLRQRDWLLLPILGFLTIVLMAVSVETIAAHVFPPFKMYGNCLVFNQSSGSRAIPHSVCYERLPETQLVEYRFNGCGDRMEMECGPKPFDSYRIVMTGSSDAFGSRVEREKTFASLLPIELSRQTKQKIELYNKAMYAWGMPRAVALRFSEILSAKPDLILWVVTPLDIKNPPQDPAVPSADIGLRGRLWSAVRGAIAGRPSMGVISDIVGILHDRLSLTHSALMLNHFLYESQSLYVTLYLMNKDDAGFLRAEPNAEWKNRLQQFSSYDADIEARARAAGVPLVVVLVPNRAQVAMISMGDWPAGYDPYKLDNELRSIVTSHGGNYIAISPGFRNVPNPEQYYLPLDGHPNAGGGEIISRLLAKELTSGAVAAFESSGKSGASPKMTR